MRTNYIGLCLLALVLPAIAAPIYKGWLVLLRFKKACVDFSIGEAEATAELGKCES